MHTILIVDDEPNYQIVLSEILKDEGYEVFTANSGLAGLPIVYSTDLDLVLSDMKMPGMDGIAFLEKIKEYNKELPVILITAYAEVEKAVEAMREALATERSIGAHRSETYRQVEALLDALEQRTHTA